MRLGPLQKKTVALLVHLAIPIAGPLLSGLKANAEYRAYELKIEDTEKGKSRTVVSTLDNLQYPRFYPLEKNEVISYVDSWMCRENTANKPICPKPSESPVTTPKTSS